jgi:hypothetical protein
MQHADMSAGAASECCGLCREEEKSMSEDAVARMRMRKAVTLFEWKCSGTYEKIRHYVSLTGIDGEWRDVGKNRKQFRAHNGAILIWRQSTGAITFQGLRLAVEEFEAKLFDAFRRSRVEA